MKTLEFTTPMTKLGVYATLKEETEIGNIIPLNPLDDNNYKYFRGEVEKDRFSIIRFKRYSNHTMLPIFSGEISETKEKTYINIYITQSKTDEIFAIVFFGITALILILLCVLGCSELIDYLLTIFTILIFDIFIFMFFFFYFKISANRTLRKLKKLLKLKQI